MPIELKEMSDTELAKHIINYTDQVIQLMGRVESALKNKPTASENAAIRTEYKNLKTSIKYDKHYVELTRNKQNESVFYKVISSIIVETAVSAFTAKVNSKVDDNMLTSLYLAKMELSDGVRYSYDDLKIIADGGPLPKY